MLSDKARRELAQELNKNINIPWVPENIEESMFYHAIGIILDALDQYIPDAMKELIYNPSVGINEEAAKIFFNRLVNILNKKIDIPYIFSEKEERQIISTILYTIMGKMVSTGDADK